MKAYTYFHAASGEYAHRGSAFKLDDVQFPANWLDAVSEQEIADKGLVPVVTVEVAPENYRDHNRAEELVGAERRVTWTRKPQAEIDAQNAIAIEAKKKQVRELREMVINRLNGIAGRGERRNKQTVAAACDAAVESLLAITDDLPTDPALVDGVILQRWQLAAAALAAAAPEAVSAFDRVDL